jgi:hypothetical protein
MISKIIQRMMQKELEVNIDFDDASHAWQANKRSKGNGTYVYICKQICSNGNPCKNPVYVNTKDLCNSYCKRHTK